MEWKSPHQIGKKNRPSFVWEASSHWFNITIQISNLQMSCPVLIPRHHVLVDWILFVANEQMVNQCIYPTKDFTKWPLFPTEFNLTYGIDDKPFTISSKFSVFIKRLWTTGSNVSSRISFSISSSSWIRTGATMPKREARRATSSRQRTTFFSFFRRTRSSVSNIRTSAGGGRTSKIVKMPWVHSSTA